MRWKFALNAETSRYLAFRLLLATADEKVVGFDNGVAPYNLMINVTFQAFPQHTRHKIRDGRRNNDFRAVRFIRFANLIMIRWFLQDFQVLPIVNKSITDT